jgi:hypothetical protein
MGQMSFINSRLIEDEIFLEEVLLIRKPLALLLGQHFSLVPSLFSLFFVFSSYYYFPTSPRHTCTDSSSKMRAGMFCAHLLHLVINKFSPLLLKGGESWQHLQ